MPQGSARFKQLLDEAHALHQAKNAGYAGVGAADPWGELPGRRRGLASIPSSAS